MNGRHKHKMPLTPSNCGRGTRSNHYTAYTCTAI